MPKVMILLVLFVALSESGCDQQRQDEQRQDVRISSLEADVKQLKTDAAELKEKQKSEHHYELRTEGHRTWRFDSATGETCIQLTSQGDWKHKETIAQSCQCLDERSEWLAMPRETDEQRKSAQAEYEYGVKPDCEPATVQPSGQ
jgi:hypothetical protein